MRIHAPKIGMRNGASLCLTYRNDLGAVRDILRIHLRSLGFEELQKSAFVHPFPCINEIEYIAKHYGIGKYVRFIIAESIDNEQYVKRRFFFFTTRSSREIICVLFCARCKSWRLSLLHCHCPHCPALRKQYAVKTSRDNTGTRNART